MRVDLRCDFIAEFRYIWCAYKDEDDVTLNGLLKEGWEPARELATGRGTALVLLVRYKEAPTCKDSTPPPH